MPEEISPAQLITFVTEALDEYRNSREGYIEWRGGTAPEKPDIKGVYYDIKEQAMKLLVIVGPFRDEKYRTGVELPISPSGWAAYRIIKTVDDVVLDVLEPNRFITEPTLYDDIENPVDYRRREYRDGQLEMLLSLANNGTIRGRPVTLSEAKNLFEALKKAQARYEETN